eukprot:GHVU01085173.1.p1 GENE.GHVU01085173.1~~GHVU01085173.1.p1  ORF type:complete len:1342 (-),score=216.71 GHVU01085173.1:36-4061(-)
MLIRCLPANLQTLFRWTLLEKQMDPDAVIERLRTTIKATGAMLGSPSAGTVVDETGPTSLFTRTPDLPRVTRPQGRGNRGKKAGGFRGPASSAAGSTGGHRNSAKCDRCGRDRHESRSECPANDAECHNCQKKGHFARCCRSKGASSENINWATVMESGEEVAWLTAEGSDRDKGLMHAYVDTCCSASLMPRTTAQGAIMQETRCNTNYRQTLPGDVFRTSSAASVAVKATATDGSHPIFGLRVNLTDSDTPTLLSAEECFITKDSRKSWATIKDIEGKEHKLKVERSTPSHGKPLPFIKLELASPHEVESPLPEKAMLSARVETTAEAFHRRLQHPCAARLKSTLAEQGVLITMKEAVETSNNCTHCKLKNAVLRSVPRSTSRYQESSEFGGHVAWDIGHISEPGLNGEHLFSLMVDSGTQWWDVKPMRSKAEAPDHLIKWVAFNGPPQRLLSDNAPELISVRVKMICRDSKIYLSTVPPYQSKVNGVAERAIREVRALLRITINQLQVPTSLWTVLMMGICELHNRTATRVNEDAASPYKRRFGVAPDLTFVIGDQVALKPPKSSSETKTLELPGKLHTYVATLDSHNILLYRKDGSKVTVLRAHPSSLQKGSIVRPEDTSQGPNEMAPGGSDSDTDDSGVEDNKVEERLPRASRAAAAPAIQALVVSPAPRTIHNHNDFGSEWQAQQSPRIDSGRSAGSTPRDAAAETRLQTGEYAIARYPNQRLEEFGVVKLLGDAGARSTSVAWQQLRQDHTLQPAKLDSIPTRLLGERVDLEPSGALPANVLERTRLDHAAPETARGGDEAALHTAKRRPKPSNKHDSNGTTGEPEHAKLRELISLLRFGVFGPKAPRDRNSMTLTWLLKQKQGPNNDSFTKARLVCRGFMNNAASETYIGTPRLPFLLLLLIYALCRKWQLGFLDITNAFLQVPLKEESGEAVPTVVVGSLPHLPEKCPFPEIAANEYERLKVARQELKEGETRQLGAALYGEKTSPRLFGFEFKETLRKEGFEEIEESVSLRKNNAQPDAIAANHVDDVIGAAEDVKRDVFNAVETRFQCKEASILQEAVPHVYLGVKYCLNQGSLTLSTDHYVKQFLENNSNEFKMRVREIRPSELKKGATNETSPHLQHKYKETLGVLGWATRLTPDQHVYHSEFGAHSAAPTPKHLNALKCALLALCTHQPPPIRFEKFEGTPTLHAFCDASFDRIEMQCRTGFKIYVGGDELPEENCNVIAWGTKRHKARVASSTSAELLGLLILVKTLWRYAYVVEKMWGAWPNMIIYIDSQALSQQLEKKGVSQEEPRLNPQLKYVAENLGAMKADVLLIPRELQRADSLTKMSKWW